MKKMSSTYNTQASNLERLQNYNGAYGDHQAVFEAVHDIDIVIKSRAFLLGGV